MTRILAINANTTDAVTEAVVRHCRATVPDVEWVGATGAFGHPYISTEAAAAIGAHAALDAWQSRAGEAFDAVLLACFGDPGLFALKEVCPVPVLGLAEASMQEAVARGARYSIVTGGVRWKPMLERLAGALGYGGALASVRPIALTGDQIAADPDAALGTLAAACEEAVRTDGAEVVILGGAALAGLGVRVQPYVSVPVIDSVICGAQRIAALAGAR